MIHKNNKNVKNQELDEYIKELVIARINAISKDLEISFGEKEYTKEEIVASIRENNELGREFIEMQLKFLRDIAGGNIYQRV